MEWFVKIVLIIILNLLLAGPLWSTENSATKGESIYKAEGCDACHGETGQGDGPAAMALNPRPPDFCTSIKHDTDAKKLRMIRGGGKKMGHSRLMPSYGQELSKQDIMDIIAYIKSLCQ